MYSWRAWKGVGLGWTQSRNSNGIFTLASASRRIYQYLISSMAGTKLGMAQYTFPKSGLMKPKCVETRICYNRTSGALNSHVVTVSYSHRTLPHSFRNWPRFNVRVPWPCRAEVVQTLEHLPSVAARFQVSCSSSFLQQGNIIIIQRCFGQPLMLAPTSPRAQLI